MDPLCLFLLDLRFPVEYELDKFNTPHTGTTLRHPQNWLCRRRCRNSLRHLATSPGDIHTSPRNNQNHKLTVTSTFLSSNCKHDFCYTMANISPSHVQRHALLSPLSHNFKSFPYFFPSYETCSINVNSLFHAAIKNLHIKPNGIFFFLLLHLLLYFTTTISEGITHTHARAQIFAENGNKRYISLKGK